MGKQQHISGYNSFAGNFPLFGITVDKLLQTEKIDEQRLFAEYKQEIIEIGTELYHATLLPDAGETETYYRGQAISQLSKTYAVNGDSVSAEKWAVKASYLMHAQEFIFSEITSGKDLLTYFRFANHWYFKNLFYMTCRIAQDDELSKDGYDQEVFEALAKLYEVVYPDGDMEFEMMAILCTLHRHIAEDEAVGNKNEALIREHLTKACHLAEKSIHVKQHRLTPPLLKGWEVYDAPTDKGQIARKLQKELAWTCFAPYRETEWFHALIQTLETLS